MADKEEKPVVDTTDIAEEFESLSWEEWNDMAKVLDAATPIFYMMWKLGRPHYSNRLPTAAVAFNKEGNCIDFAINRQFWNSLTKTQKAFIVAHECMHVVLNHGLRIRDLFGKNVLMDCANKAMDIVVNELLVRNYFIRNELGDFSKSLCWLDTCFEPSDNAQPNQSFEYYFNLLSNKTYPNSKGKGESKENSGGKLLDDHSGLWDKGAKWEELEDFFNQVADGVTPKDLQDFIDKVKDKIENVPPKSDQSRGTTPGGGFLVVKVEAKPKKKWETVIKRWANMQIKENDKDHEQWARINRRFVFMSSDMFIPTEIEVEELEEEKKKIAVWFFQDTSGSCAHLAKRFFTAAKSLPKKLFDVRMFCFDTQVYETSLLSGKLYGFGGTSFTCIEQEIQKLISKEKLQYPKAVFVVTDGYGDRVSPQIPKNWYWFLSCNAKHCIPDECHTFDLTKFE